MNALFALPNFDYSSFDIPTPYYVVDRARLRRNMEVLHQVAERSGAKILLALKAFSTWGMFDELTPYLAGTTASSIYEAQLGREKFGKELHIYSPAYSKEEMSYLCTVADTVVFNSVNQWKAFQPMISNCGREIEVGLRINPEYSEVQIEIYNPCTSRSRFGIREDGLYGVSLDGVDGFHFHTICQQGSDVLERTLLHVEQRFDRYFPMIKWINFGGGHHITRQGYDIEHLIDLLIDFKERTGLQIYLEPGEAHVLYSGFLVTSVLDIIANPNNLSVVIVDTSAAAHMPDVLEMPYTPEILGARRVIELADAPLESGRYKYIVGGKTCLSGDIIGEYQFRKPLIVGDRLVFGDMSQYTMCKNTMFNGLQLPAIVSCDSDLPGGDFKVLRQFGYEDFYTRLS